MGAYLFYMEMAVVRFHLGLLKIIYMKTNTNTNTNTCMCGLAERLDGQHYCEQCLKDNPFLCS
jgi:hypothetical protein